MHIIKVNLVCTEMFEFSLPRLTRIYHGQVTYFCTCTCIICLVKTLIEFKHSLKNAWKSFLTKENLLPFVAVLEPALTVQSPVAAGRL